MKHSPVQRFVDKDSQANPLQVSFEEQYPDSRHALKY